MEQGAEKFIKKKSGIIIGDTITPLDLYEERFVREAKEGGESWRGLIEAAPEEADLILAEYRFSDGRGFDELELFEKIQALKEILSQMVLQPGMSAEEAVVEFIDEGKNESIEEAEDETVDEVEDEDNHNRYVYGELNRRLRKLELDQEYREKRLRLGAPIEEI